MDVFEPSVSTLTTVCRELTPLVQNYSYAIDASWLRTAIDQVFNEIRIDLVTIFKMPGSPGEFEQVVELFGVKSPIFKMILESCDELFEYFLTSFCSHLERSQSNLPTNAIECSVYMYLLEQYVCLMLPLDDHLSVAMSSFRPEMAMRCSYRTPLSLFGEESLRKFSLSSSSQSMYNLRKMSQSLSPHFLSFMYVLVRSYCSLNSWPSDYRLVALRFVLKEIHAFILAETQNSNLAQLKWQLQCNTPFADPLFDFFSSLFSRWPSNPSFTLLFDVWITWIRPWRYCNNDITRVMSFVRANRRFYTDLCDAFLKRSMPVDEPSNVSNIKTFLMVLTSSEMLQVFSVLEYDIEENLIMIAKSLKKNLLNLKKKTAEEEAMLDGVNCVKRLLFCEEEKIKIERYKRTANELEKLVSQINFARLDESSDETEIEDIQQCGNLSRNSVKTPDHTVDNENKLMYLTPLGRTQVGDGTHRFDYSKCSESIPPIIAPLRRDEIWWLSRCLYHLSRTINKTNLLEYLSNSYSEYSSLSGFVARLLLDPEYPRVYVPAHSVQVLHQKPCLNLRYLARYHFVIPFCVFIALLMVISFQHALTALALMAFYAWLIR